ncbi:hypothetical protein Tco_1367368 [Tanacetum coccineum]
MDFLLVCYVEHRTLHQLCEKWTDGREWEFLASATSTGDDDTLDLYRIARIAPPCDQELELPQVLPVGSIVFSNTCVHNINSVESNVFPRYIYGNIGTVNLSVSLKRRCIRESSLAPPRDQALQLPQLAPVGPSVFSNTCNHQSTSIPSRDFNWHTSETPPINMSDTVSIQSQATRLLLALPDIRSTMAEIILTQSMLLMLILLLIDTQVQAYLLLAISNERPAPDKLLIMICDKEFLTAFCLSRLFFSDEEIEGPMKDQPLSADASPTTLSPGYIANSKLKEDDEGLMGGFLCIYLPMEEIYDMTQRVANAIEAIAIYETKTNMARKSISQTEQQECKLAENANNKRKWEGNHNGQCTVKGGNYKKIGHRTWDCRNPAAARNQRTHTFYECGSPRHFKSECPIVKFQKCVDKKISTLSERQAENKRKLNNTSKNNQNQQQPNKRQNTGKPYAVGHGEKKYYGGL